LELRRPVVPGRARPGPTAADEGPDPQAEAEAEEGHWDREGHQAALPEALEARAPRATIPGRGALAKLAKAPVSKTGDSRFQSWVPRRERPAYRGVSLVR